MLIKKKSFGKNGPNQRQSMILSAGHREKQDWGTVSQYSVKAQNRYPNAPVKTDSVDVQRLSCVRLFVIPWTAGHQASPSFTISWSLLKFMCTETVMPPNHLILCHPLLLLPSIFPSIRTFLMSPHF